MQIDDKPGPADGKTDDEDVSPMAAQNTGPERTGPSDPPLREEKRGPAAKARESDSAAMKKGGEDLARDDL